VIDGAFCRIWGLRWWGSPGSSAPKRDSDGRHSPEGGRHAENGTMASHHGAHDHLDRPLGDVVGGDAFHPLELRQSSCCSFGGSSYR